MLPTPPGYTVHISSLGCRPFGSPVHLPVTFTFLTVSFAAIYSAQGGFVAVYFHFLGILFARPKQSLMIYNLAAEACG